MSEEYDLRRDVERELLSAMINNPVCFFEGIKQLKSYYFKNETNKYVFDLMFIMFEKNMMPTLTDFLIEDKRQKDRPNFPVKFSEIIAEFTFVVGFMAMTNFDNRVKLLKEYYIVDLYNNKSDKKMSFEDVINSSSDVYDLINQELIGMGEASHFSEVASRGYEKLLERIDAFKLGKPIGISSGISVLDSKTGGFRSGELIIIAARPSMGKSALALFMAKKAVQDKNFVTFFSLEMDDVSLYDRLVLSECGVDAQRYKNGNINEIELHLIKDAAAELSKSEFYIDDNPKVSIKYIKTTTTLMRNKGQCDLIVIDYLQLADVNKKGLNREQAIAETTRELKILAKDLGIPIILLSQLNRETEDSNLNIPQLSHLRESGAIEQDADTVLLLTRPAYYGISFEALQKKYQKIPPEIQTTKGLMLINIAKQRSGSTGMVFCRHNEFINNFFDI